MAFMWNRRRHNNNKPTLLIVVKYRAVHSRRLKGGIHLLHRYNVCGGTLCPKGSGLNKMGVYFFAKKMIGQRS